MKKQISKAVRRILCLDRVRLDTLVDEILQKNRDALVGKRERWSRLHSS